MSNKREETGECPADHSCADCSAIVGKVGLGGNLILALLKLVVGVMCFSTALLADALYSILDVGFSILIIVGLKISGKPPDETHDYGHGKIEFIITIVFSVLTVLGALLLFTYALYELHEGVFGQFSKYVLLVALASIMANWLFYRYTECVAEQIQSPAIRSLAKHSKADAISSLLVAFSMLCAYQGYNDIGPFVAIIETAHLLLIGVEIFKDSLDGLLDAAISNEEIIEIKGALETFPDIKNIHYVKSRKIGQKVWLNISMEIPAFFSVNRVDRIKENIEEMLSEKITNLEKIMINIVPWHEAPEKTFAEKKLVGTG